jgi:predicted transposase YdaD
MFELSDLKQTKVYQQALEEGRQQGLQQGLLEGRQQGLLESRLEGRQQGRQEAKIEGKLECVPRFLELGLTVEQIAKVFALDVEIVQKKANQHLDNEN